MIVSELSETWEGDGGAGVAFKVDERYVFVTRWSDRGEPANADEGDWVLARRLEVLIRRHGMTDQSDSLSPSSAGTASG